MERDITSSLKVRHLQLILALADHATTHRAAAALNMTQSNVSKMLRDIEEIFAAALFERAPRGIRPTPLGQFVVSEARSQVSRLQRFSDDFRARRDGGYGTLVLGTISGAAPGLVARSLAEIRRERPQLKVVLHGETSDTILDMLEDGRLDLAVGRFSSERHHLVFDFEPLAEESLVVVARAGHALQDRTLAGLTDLADWPWILQHRSTPTRKVLDSAFARAGLKPPEEQIECSSLLAILNLVQVSDAVTLLPASVVGAHLAAGLLTELRTRDEIRLESFGLVMRQKEPLSQPAREIADLLRRNAALGHW